MHFCYRKPAGDLQQGDLLEVTPGLKQVLAEVHPHYATHEDYRYLSVLTQSCDLVRRNGRPCKSPYISLAAVRPLETALRRELAKYQYSNRERIYGLASSENKKDALQFLERIYNNNEPRYFYYHPEVQLGLSAPVVAFLALSIALKAELHYATCVEARIVQLDDAFQNKLGWLVGHMYSRVGTQEWVPDQYPTREALLEHLTNLLEERVLWLDGPIRKRILDRLKEMEAQKDGVQLPREELMSLVEEIQRNLESKKDQVLDRFIDLVLGDCTPEEKKKAKNRLRSDEIVMKALR